MSLWMPIFDSFFTQIMQKSWNQQTNQIVEKSKNSGL